MTNIWVSADHHFYHKNIIKYSHRPFTTIDEMNEVLIENHNAVVRPEDDVYFLGDFVFGSMEVVLSIVDRMHGRKFFVTGSHDHTIAKSKDRCLQRFKWVQPLAELTLSGQFVVFCHYPMLSWARSHYGSWQLFGHHHGHLGNDHRVVIGLDMNQRLQMDTGVDTESETHKRFFPYHWDEITAEMSKRDFTPIDKR